MLYIQMEEKYRERTNELLKSFLEENSWSYTGPQSVLSKEDAIMRFSVETMDDKAVLRGSLWRANNMFYCEEETVRLEILNRMNEVQIPLKRILYKLLVIYTQKILPWGILTGIRPVKIVNSFIAQGESIDNISKKMTDYYLLSEEKARLSIEVAMNQRQYISPEPNKLSIYIGIPFCTSRCLYCSFSSVPVKKYVHLINGYLAAVRKEIEWASSFIKDRSYHLDTIYIGGGTPTALPEEEFNIFLKDITRLLPLDTVREFTVEAGRPDTINREKLNIMKCAGVTRISINPQTMHNKTLELIGRSHTAEEFLHAFEMAQEEGFDNINCDLIAGLPEETLDDFADTIEQICRLNAKGVTVHTMSVKRASRLNKEKEHFKKTADSIVTGMIELAGTYLRQTGLRPYYLYRQKNILANLENVGYAKPGYEGLYNILIMEELQTILALGAGAVTKIVFPDNRIERVFNVKNVEQYIQRIDEMLERKNLVYSYLI